MCCRRHRGSSLCDWNFESVDHHSRREPNAGTQHPLTQNAGCPRGDSALLKLSRNISCVFVFVYVCFVRTWTLCLRRSPSRYIARIVRAFPSAPSHSSPCSSFAPNTGGSVTVLVLTMAHLYILTLSVLIVCVRALVGV